jgi:segregation and condensation protein A
VSYVVRLDSFEGPLDLLLYLIQREEMDIYDIPIARITEQYLRHIDLMEKLDLHPAGEFLVMAATLMRIKARLLLPVQRPGEETEEDPRHELVQRLLEYKKFKEAARKLEEREAERLRSFTRPLDPGLVEEMKSYGDEITFEVSLGEMMKALQSVLARLDEVVTHEVQLEPVALEDKMALLEAHVHEHGRLAFADLFAGDRTRIEVIVTFMAMLELMKRGVLSVHQAENFSELWIWARDPQAAARLDEAGEPVAEPDPERRPAARLVPGRPGDRPASPPPAADAGRESEAHGEA